jgi:hypothetical protein
MTATTYFHAGLIAEPMIVLKHLTSDYLRNKLGL